MNFSEASLDGFEVFGSNTAPQGVISIQGLTTYLQDLLAEDRVLSHLWITAEVSSISVHRNGHLFLTLADPDSGDLLKGVVWQSQVLGLSFFPKAGQQILALGQMRLYAKSSTYQIQIWQMLPAGEGLRALQREQLRRRLADEGLFDSDRKLPLPIHPLWVGVISSPQAAAWGDMQRSWRHRYPGLQVVFAAATVQGEQAAESIVQAFQTLTQDGRAEVVILARGGGAREDLDCFDDERVVRAIVECPLPVVTGIGHQRDETLADLAADYTAHTPTAAAERVVPSLDQLRMELQAQQEDLYTCLHSALQRSREWHQELRSRLQHLRLDQQVRKLQQAEKQLQHQLHFALEQRLHQAQVQVQSLSLQLQALDPNAVLRRGYALIRTRDGVWLRDPSVPPGTPLILELAAGPLYVRVEAVPEISETAD
ncbi:MAG: exodeoxyribonuclease VII large subunit [Synechococcaceae cyanobacterium SM2_3_1]|nr:exodeoxyribonuclease VII large subunit [Synechococcaceae cyanobacterium SM2_3_1]